MTRRPKADPVRVGMAKAARERTCIVTRTVKPEGELIRLAIAPDGAVVADLRARLPGRGAWVSADRASVDTAVRKGMIAKSAQRSVAASADLADQIAAALYAQCLSRLGLARRSGALVAGFHKAVDALSRGDVAWLIEARDGAADGRRRLLNARKKAGETRIALAGCFPAVDIGRMAGRGATAHAVLRGGPDAARFTVDAHRLAGFTPLIPGEWDV